MYLANPQDKIILALDEMDALESLEFVRKIPDLIWVKVGLELFVANGPQVLDELRNEGKKIFLDLKLHDIPNTMARTCYRAAKSGAQLITVHACAGEKALLYANEAALKGAAEASLPEPILLAVTVLTSWSTNEFARDLNIEQPLGKRVEHLASLAHKAGIKGCVCSPLEVKALRKTYPYPFELVTPGIRLYNQGVDDQARVMTPREALTSGASRLVIGRSITKASNPTEIFKRICNEISEYG
ncbi:MULTISPECIES: orotidine-5'-phosphate decarboxylase [Prochlorococcus]|uniref:orotidine-5'-phosphate decarboxylase n=1 Tax=Prochlorococcus TaxID=1218 RepID=UPI000533AECC|nr:MULTISPECIES: orotidine-5'-phosphate decarboxylase [Prochlorococcus]KGG11948.1 Orotidine 5'-phosphate decarboxylase [Prochlorococcus sp. MIT 0601]